MKKIILSLFLLLVIVSVRAQNATVEGVVRQRVNGAELPGISVYIENTKSGAASNAKGYYVIKDIAPGEYTLVTRGIGFHTVKNKITLSAGATLNYDIALEENVLDLPEVMVQSLTITGGAGRVNEIPGSAYYLSPKEIQQFSYTDINRALRTVPGVNIQEEDGYGLRPNIGLRGTGVERCSKITVMEDGVLMAPAPYASPAAYYFPTMGRMQAIEIMKGSSQVRYGPFTTGGAINLISTQLPEKFMGRVHLTAGSYGTRNLHAYIGNTHKNVAYMAETFIYGSQGFKELDGGGNTGFDKKDFLMKLRVNTNPDAKVYQSLTFKAGQVTEEANETYLGLTETDFAANPLRRYAASQNDVMDATQRQLSLTWFIQPAKFVDITTTAYRTDFHRNWYKLDAVKDTAGVKTSIASVLENPEQYAYQYSVVTGTSSLSDNALSVKANNRTYYSQGVQSIIAFNFSTGKVAHRIDAGLRYHRDEMDRFQHEDYYRMNNSRMQLTQAGTAGTESNQLVDATAWAAFVQYKLKYKNLSVVPGIRMENVTIKKDDYGKADPQRTGADLKQSSNTITAFIPGVGVDYKFNKNVGVFAGVHKGFAPPGAADGAKPEESYNYELGLRGQGWGFNGQVCGFYNVYQNLLGSDLAASGGNGTGDQFNGGKAESRGVEVQLSYDLLSPLNGAFLLPLSLAYTYTDAVFKSSFKSDFEDWGTVNEGDKLPYLANHQFSFVLALEHKLFGINLSGRYSSAMRTQAGQGEMPATERTDAAFVLDGSASVVAHKNISLFAGVTNITNNVYVVARRPSGLRPSMPRAFMVGIKADF